MQNPVPSRKDVFATITEKIVTAVEAGADEFRMPWHGGIMPPEFPLNAATQKPYRGVNVVSLWAEAMLGRYISGHWASYKQWQSIGAQVRKGSRGAPIVFYKALVSEQEDGEPADEDGKSASGYIARLSYVFNADQVDGWTPPIPEPKTIIQLNEEVAAFITGIGADIRHGSHRACYRHDLDRIEIPEPSSFIGTRTSTPTEAYHSVLLHETVHWSGAPQRLNREFGRRFGDETYAFEELIAELGAAFLCSAFRIAIEPRADHAAYIASWLTVLGRDHKAIFKAASRAREAFEYLRALATPMSDC